MSEGHEIFTPDDDERLSRVESSLSILNILLRGDRGTRNKGFINETEDRLNRIENNVIDVKELSKHIKVGIWCLAAGVIIALIIFGVITINQAKEAINLVK